MKRQAGAEVLALTANDAGDESSVGVACDYCRLPVPRCRARTPDRIPAEPLYCCYGCSLAARITQSRGETGQAAWMLTRLGLSVFFSMAVMVFAMYLYGQEVHRSSGVPASPTEISLTGVMRYLSLLFATPVFFILGVPILSNAMRQFRNRIVSVDALVVLGVAAAFIYSYVSTITEKGATYYETACMILVLVTLGRWLEATGKLKASAAVKALEALIPAELPVRRDGKTMRIPSQEIRAGDVLTVPAGQRIAADGVIESGQAHVDEQIVTGESTPVTKSVGQTVRAGTVSIDGALTVRATAVGSDSTLGRLISLLESAKKSKARFERLADRVATVFVPVTVTLAIVAGALGFFRGGTDEAIMSALAVMLIACPCALGIATPMAIWVSLGRAARSGVLFRNGKTIESLAGIRAVCFDKTGTLTTGQPEICSFVTRADGRAEQPRILALAGGLSTNSVHVIAQSVKNYAEEQGVTSAPILELRTIPGRGLVGTVNGQQVFLGSVALMEEESLHFDDGLRNETDRILSQGQSIACIGWDRTVQGVFAFSETLRSEAKGALDRLKSLGCRVMVLTGDHHRRGREIAEALGVETAADLAPQDKIRRIEQTRRECGPVAMVGDGLNDAPALAAADVGLAMGCGADVTREAADVCLLGNDLASLPWVVKLARRTVRTIRQNLFWAFAYNLVGVSLAMTGRLSPIFAAGAMVLSSLIVVGNSLRLDRVGPEVSS